VRYRPFGSEGRSASAVSLTLHAGRKADDVFHLVCSALESGVNTFSLPVGDEPSAEAIRRAVAAVGRRVLILMLRLDLEGPKFDEQVRSALRSSGATAFDAVMVERPGPAALAPARLAELEAIRAARLALRIGVADEAEAAHAKLESGAFDLLALRYNLTSGWAERNVLKAAAQRGLAVVGYGPNIQAEEPDVPPALRGIARLFRRDPVARDEGYRFLRETPDWSAEQICLAFALTEPGLASVLVEVETAKAIEALACVVERELPAGVAAQIEMARFAGGRRGAA
jgi:aryl-alcohol dehydrogenase-like predicted oxidoreductase